LRAEASASARFIAALLVLACMSGPVLQSLRTYICDAQRQRLAWQKMQMALVFTRVGCCFWHHANQVHSMMMMLPQAVDC
jgi:hypothetical protein